MTGFRPPWAPSLNAVFGIPVCYDADQPDGTVRLDLDPGEPRHIARIWSAACTPDQVRFTAEQTARIRDHYSAMNERAARALIDYQRLLAQLGPRSPSAYELADPSCSCSHVDAVTGHHPLSQHPDGGRCTGVDSYGLPCQCPSFELHEETESVINERT
ncbi:hypothetical protein [Verrucosispora sp. TAA-831]|uniref:hypothetical protein n=1 Tax=Verrucosispora sp. TAA-831 TaxID=3422227 RepID=UPI003D6EE64D